VDYYDETRALSPAAEAAVQAQLRAVLAGRGPCLEIGVGTGRIALPLAQAGIGIVGADLSRRMMERIAAKAGGRSPLPLVQADATRLPFRAGRFGAAIACHVLHLIPLWQQAVGELLRVLRPGGLLLVEDRMRRPETADGTATQSRQIRGEITRYFHRASGAVQRERGLTDLTRLDTLLRDMGASLRLLEPVVEERTTTLERVIDRLERGQSSSTWHLDAAELRAAAEETRHWARQRFGALNAPLTARRTIVWRAYTPPLDQTGARRPTRAERE
jgi:ubiquinone/menaquinone biosynthesis C-methylase UbiE